MSLEKLGKLCQQSTVVAPSLGVVGGVHYLREIGDSLIDFIEWFNAEELQLESMEVKQIFDQLTSIFESAFAKPSASGGYFNLMTSYFKDSGKETQLRETCGKLVKQLCVIVAGKHHHTVKMLEIQEFLLLHPFIAAAPPELKIKPVKFLHNPLHVQTAKFFSEFLKENTQKLHLQGYLFWSDVRSPLEEFLKERLVVNPRWEVSYAEVLAVLKTALDVSCDNLISFNELNELFAAALSADPLTLDSILTACSGGHNHRRSHSSSLILNLTKFPDIYSTFYSGSGTRKAVINHLFDRVVFGRVNNTNSLSISSSSKSLGTAINAGTLLAFPAEEVKISRQQFAVVKDDMGEFYLEKLPSQQTMTIRIDDDGCGGAPFLVRPGYQFAVGKRVVLTVDTLTPTTETFVLGGSLLHPLNDFPFVELKADMNIAGSQSKLPNHSSTPPPQAVLTAKGIQYLFTKPRFTVGRSPADDIQVDVGDLQSSLVFEYIDNYSWVVTQQSPQKSISGGSYFSLRFPMIPSTNNAAIPLKRKPSKVIAASDDIAENQQADRNRERKQSAGDEERQGNSNSQSFKLRIFHGLSFAVSEFECQFEIPSS